MKRKTNFKNKRSVKRKLFTSPYASSGSGVPPRLSQISARSGNKQVIKLSQICEKLVVNTNAGGDFLGAFAFQLQDLPNVNSFAGMFDQYRIKMVKVEIVTNVTCNATAGAGGVGVVNEINPGTIITVIDTDDSVVPPTNASLFSHDTCKVHGTTNGTKYVRWIEPMVDFNVFQASTGTFVGVGGLKDTWIDMATTNVSHFGFKYLLRAMPFNTGALSANTTTFYCTYYMEFRKTI